MADLVTEHITIAASPDACFATAVDFERYPEWARDLKRVTVLNRDDQGRARDVAFRAAGMGHSAKYTLRYDYDAAPDRLAWVLLDGELVRKLDGYYEFRSSPDHPGQTEARYRLEVELILPLPGFVKRRTQSKIMHTALRELKTQVELEAG